MLTRRLSIALVCLLLWAASPVAADVIYQYTGNPFTTATSPYTTSDFVSGTIQLSSVLLPNLNHAPLTLNAFSFSDGVDTLSSGNSSPHVAEISTDGSGVITAWFFEFDNVLLSFRPNGFIATASGGLGNCAPTPGAIAYDFGSPGDPACGIFLPSGLRAGTAVSGAYNADDPGVWTLVPEPSTSLLLAWGVMGLAARRRHTRGAARGERALV